MNITPYSKETQKLIDKLCKIAERKKYTLKKKQAEETILKTYDVFKLKRPSKVVWHTHIDDEFSSSAYRASRASRAYSASSAYSAYSAYSASRASRAYSAYRASRAYRAYRAYRASRAYRAYSASRAYRAYRAYSAYRVYSASIDTDFDYSVAIFEYIQHHKHKTHTQDELNYNEYSKLVIKAKELGVGYFFDYEDVLHLVPVPIITCDEQGRYHSTKGPALSLPGEKIYYLNGVRFDKNWWSKISKGKLSASEVFSIDNIEHRRVAYELMDKTKMKKLKDYKVLDEKIDGKGNKMKIISFNVQNMNENLIFYNCICPSTKREYFVQTKETTCDKAKDASFGLSDVEWINEW